MKHIKSILFLTALVVILLLNFTACNDRGDINSPQQQNFDSPQFAIIDYTDLQNALEDGTLDKDMTFNSTMMNYSFINMGMTFTPGNPMMKGNPWLANYDFTKQLGRIFRQLQLTDDQKTQIKGFMVTFHDSAKVQVKKFFDANKSIIDSANAQRRAIVKDLRDGKITREQSQTKLKDLNQKTRDLITANPVSQAVKQALCDLRTQLFQNIKSVLNSDQSTKWDSMIAKLKSPC